jgi:Tfp pilus assembly protein PilF
VKSGSSRGADLGRTIGILAALCVLTFCVYSGVAEHDFVEFDDRLYVLANPNLDGRIGLDDVRRAFVEPYAANWAPLMSLSLATSDAMHGPNAGAYAVTNVLLHVVAGALLFLTLVRLTGRRGASAWVAAVFLVHPLHVESVAWISQRKDVLAAVFWMGALFVYSGSSKGEGAGRRIWIFVLSMCAMFAKATAVAVPLTLLLLDLWPLRRFESWRDIGRLVLEKWELLALSIGVSLATVFAQTEAMPTDSPVPLRFLNAGLAYTTYIIDSFWPADLAAYYPFPSDAELLGPRAFGALALLLAISIASLVCWRRTPLVTMGWFWFLGTLVPMIGIVRVGGQSHADRYMYVAQIGLTLIVAFGIDGLIGASNRSSRKARRVAVVVAGVASVVALAVAAHQQVGAWRSTLDLWASAVRSDPTNYFAHGAVGKAYWIAGDRVSSEKHLKQALRLEPRAASARVVLATIYLQTGRSRLAEAELDRAWVDGGDPATIWAARGALAGNRGDERAASEAYVKALAAEPKTRDWEMLNNLAWIRAASRDPSLRDPSRALELAGRALDIRPDDPFVRGTLAAALASSGRVEEAVSAQRRAIDALRERGLVELLPDFEERLALYGHGQPPWAD